jgi:hypothetical protein
MNISKSNSTMLDKIISKHEKIFSISFLRLALPVVALSGLTLSAQVLADEAQDINAMESTIRTLQQRLDAMQMQQQNSATHAAASASAHSQKYDGIQAGPLNIKFGGFVELASIYRSRNETGDVGSSWNAIPYENSSNYYIDEFRESARQSRISMLVSGPNDDHEHAEAYYEMDFLGAAQTANSKESNSYNPRVRHAYATYYNDDAHLYLLGGQTWSLLTQEKKGMNPRDELIPMTIDAQYVPGFNWTRNAQLRFVDKFSDAVSLGISAESPQTLYSGKAPNGIIYDNTGGSLFNNANKYTFDSMPDLIAKITVDPGFGHYELFGMTRKFRDREIGGAATNGSNNTATGSSVGGGLYLPLVPKAVDFQASFLTGKGVGRYGSAQLPDATFAAGGGITALQGTTALAGLVGHVANTFDLYGYWGMEKVDRRADAATHTGYGDPTVNLSGCYYETGTCPAANEKVSQATIGGWWKFYRGAMGNMQLGLQASYTKLAAFSGLGGQSPNTHLKAGMISFRYYPYQQ